MIFKCLAVLICVNVVFIYSLNDTCRYDAAWEKFKRDCNKSYFSADEAAIRKQLFQANLIRVEEHNRKFKANLVKFNCSISCIFSDLKKMEYNAFALGYDNDYTKSGVVLKKETKTPPLEWDWRHYISDKPRSQGLCSCAYALVSTECIENQVEIRQGKKVNLSPQELIDCSLPSGNLACDGGRMEYSYKYIAERGINHETDYPFKGEVGKCCKKNVTAPINLVGFADIQEHNETDLQCCVMYGPVSCAVDGSNWSFYHYSSGIYCEPECSSYNLCVPVKAVGFGVEKCGTEYWIIKNYFGPNWGENGYMRLHKNANNHCGIATKATIPIIKT